MTERVRIQDMSRQEVENALLLYQGLAKRMLEAVRASAKVEWKVRRDVEEIASKYTTLLSRHVERADAAVMERLAQERTARRMDELWGRHA